MAKKVNRLEIGGAPPNRNPKKTQISPARAVAQPTRTKTTKPANRAKGCLWYLWIPHPTKRRRAVGPAPGMTRAARMKASLDPLIRSSSIAYVTAYQVTTMSSVMAPSATRSRAVESVDRGTIRPAPRTVIAAPQMCFAPEWGVLRSHRDRILSAPQAEYFRTPLPRSASYTADTFERPWQARQ